MKLVFLCGSLELGCDGVGDYVRRLAEELFKQGHEIGAVALNDPSIKEDFTEIQRTDEFHFSILRISSGWPAEKRFAKAKTWIDAFDPEWLSLQFVIFSYHPKGLPFGLSGMLFSLSKGRRLHIMFHELWVGMSEDSTNKLLVWGWIQKQIITSVIKKLNPEIIHTQTKLYQAQLTRLGFTSKYLPLFSNIPLVNSKEYNHKLHGARGANDTISLVVFGTIHPGAPIKQFTEEVALYTAEHNKQVSLVVIGRNGAEQKHWADIWQSAGLPIELLGEQSAERVSEILSSASMGVSTTPVALMEKSGTVAAMREHGLVVLSVSKPWKLKGYVPFDIPPETMEYQSGNLGACFNQEKKASFLNSVSNISHMMTADLLSSV